MKQYLPNFQAIKDFFISSDMDSARGVLGVMQGAGLEPSSETYTVLLVGLAEHGDMEGINATLAECEAADIVLHDRELMEVVYALAVKGHDGFVTEVCDLYFFTLMNC